LSKPPLKRNLVSQQLFSGHLRLDMANPMSQGNFIVLKGDKRASGKEMVVQGAINSFLAESPNNRVVYVGLHQKTADDFFSKTERKE
jgi:F0F1-type ATP synthase alpha subunit